MAYAPQNAFVHPMIDTFSKLVKGQEELKQMKETWQKHVMQEKYLIPNPTTYAHRFDVVRAKRDAMQMKEFEGFFDRLKDRMNDESPAKHTFSARGIELSPEDRPMKEDNIKINIEDGGIDAAVAKAKELDRMVVSKDVWCQLTEDQRTRLAVVDGVHQYAVGSVARATMKNPTGYWPVGSGDIGYTIRASPGVKRTYHVNYQHCEFVIERIPTPDVIIEVGNKLAGLYGLGVGRYRFTTAGIDYLGPCEGEGMTEVTARKAMAPYSFRDKRGYHGSDQLMVGECSRKIDGIFCYLSAKNGQVSLKFRNGETWIGKSDVDLECAMELVDDKKCGKVFYILYVDIYKGNQAALDKGLQEYFRKRISITIKMGNEVIDSVMSDANLPSDGIVIWGLTRQTFFKEFNTVDITKRMALELIAEHNIKINGVDDMEDGPIYELAVVHPFLLRSLNGMQPRERISKILPNKMKNVLGTLRDPTINDVRLVHAKHRDDPASLCAICRYI